MVDMEVISCVWYGLKSVDGWYGSYQLCLIWVEICWWLIWKLLTVFYMVWNLLMVADDMEVIDCICCGLKSVDGWYGSYQLCLIWVEICWWLIWKLSAVFDMGWNLLMVDMEVISCVWYGLKSVDGWYGSYQLYLIWVEICWWLIWKLSAVFDMGWNLLMVDMEVINCICYGLKSVDGWYGSY